MIVTFAPLPLNKQQRCIVKTPAAAMCSLQHVNAAGDFTAGGCSLAVYLHGGSPDLSQPFVEDISIIGSLFNCEPGYTQAEVMSPSRFFFLAKHHLLRAVAWRMHPD